MDAQFAAPQKTWRELKNLLRAAVDLDSAAASRRAWRALRKRQGKLVERAAHSLSPGAPYEASGTAVLRSHWSRQAVALALAFDRPEMQIELSDGRESLLHGAWPLEVVHHGQRLPAPRVGWDIVCWEQSRKAQWLETELKFDSGVRVERGILLAPRDEFVLLLDAVIGPDSEPDGEIDYATRLPLAAGVRAEQPAETTEVLLRGQRRLARILPLAIGEWRSDPRGGRLSVVDGGLELRQQNRAGALCAPLLIDYSRRRRKKPLTWRQLTVGEGGQPVGRDVAAAYRFQIGKRQWLIYRALRSRGNRTVLGQNLNTELLVARLLPNGDVKTIVEIE